MIPNFLNVRRRPGSANGVFFTTIEDETGDANVLVWEKVGEELSARSMTPALS